MLPGNSGKGMCSTGGIRPWDAVSAQPVRMIICGFLMLYPRYVKHTGDDTILDENVKFIEGRLLNPGEDSCYELPGVSEQAVVLYEHCKLSIQHGLRFGSHGLPLIGFRRLE